MSSGLNSSTNSLNLALESAAIPADLYIPTMEVKLGDTPCSGVQEIDQLLSHLEAPFGTSTDETASKVALTSEGDSIRQELDYFKRKAIEQDIEIFEMRALLQSGKGLSNILNLKQLLDTFMAVVREKYSAVNTAVLLKDDLENAEHCFRVKAHFGLDEKFRHPSGMEESIYMYKFPKNNGLLWQLIQQGNVFSVRDMQRGPRFKHAWKQWNMNILKSDVWCPLIKSGEVLGILTIGEREDGSQIPESDYAFIQELASIAITNIDSTLKYEKNERILKNIQTLYDVNQQIANVNDFKKLCIETLSKAVDVLMTQKGNLMIYNKITRKLEIRVVWGNIPIGVRDEINNGLVETKSFDLGEGVAGICADTKKPIRVNDRMLIPQVGQHEVFCMASVPILYGNELEGVINMTNKVMIDEEGNKVLDPLGRFTEEDVSLLLGLADQAAVNLNKTRIYSQSITDRMTGLHNSRHFEQVFFDLASDSIQTNKPMALAIVDIDRFKLFNDQHGHSAGDEVLKHVAKIFESCTRPGTGDIAFRYGGEEFCMLLPETSPVDAMNVLEAFRAKVEAAKLQHGEKSLEVTVSVGLASSVLDGAETKDLFERADETLYACKNGGRNQVRHFAAGRMVRFQPINLAAEIDNAYSGTNQSI